MPEVETDEILELDPTEEEELTNTSQIDPIDDLINPIIETNLRFMTKDYIDNLIIKDYVDNSMTKDYIDNLMKKTKPMYKEPEHRIFYIVETINKNNKKTTKTFNTLKGAENEVLIRRICNDTNITIVSKNIVTNEKTIIKEI